MDEGLGNAGVAAKAEVTTGSAADAVDQAGRIMLAQAATAPSGPAPSPPPALPAVEPSAAPTAATHFDAVATKVVRLPQGTSIDNIEVSGKDIVLKQADGRTIVIDNGVS